MIQLLQLTRKNRNRINNLISNILILQVLNILCAHKFTHCVCVCITYTLLRKAYSTKVGQFLPYLRQLGFYIQTIQTTFLIYLIRYFIREVQYQSL